MPKSKTQNSVCPNCGYCPHCGRSNGYRTYPWYPYPWYTPAPWFNPPFTISTTPTWTAGNTSGTTTAYMLTST